MEIKILKYTIQPHLNGLTKLKKPTQLRKVFCAAEDDVWVAVELTSVCCIGLNNCCMAAFEFYKYLGSFEIPRL